MNFTVNEELNGEIRGVAVEIASTLIRAFIRALKLIDR